MTGLSDDELVRADTWDLSVLRSSELSKRCVLTTCSRGAGLFDVRERLLLLLLFETRTKFLCGTLGCSTAAQIGAQQVCEQLVRHSSCEEAEERALCAPTQRKKTPLCADRRLSLSQPPCATRAEAVREGTTAALNSMTYIYCRTHVPPGGVSEDGLAISICPLHEGGGASDRDGGAVPAMPKTGAWRWKAEESSCGTPRLPSAFVASCFLRLSMAFFPSGSIPG